MAAGARPSCQAQSGQGHTRVPAARQTNLLFHGCVVDSQVVLHRRHRLRRRLRLLQAHAQAVGHSEDRLVQTLEDVG